MVSTKHPRVQVVFSGHRDAISGIDPLGFRPLSGSD
jgi:hypothetical protein